RLYDPVQQDFEKRPGQSLNLLPKTRRPIFKSSVALHSFWKRGRLSSFHGGMGMVYCQKARLGLCFFAKTKGFVMEKNRPNGLRVLLRFLQGMLIGVGAVLPGISGGVLCVVFGIYKPVM